MGPLDLLRAFAPGAASQSPRNPWIASANPPPFRLFGPAPYDWSDIAGPMPLPDRSDGSNPLEPMLMPARPYAEDPPERMPMIDRPDLSIDDVRPLLLAGAASQIGPGDFPLNPDDWAPTLPGRSAPWEPTTPAGLPAIMGADSAALSRAGYAQPRLGLDALNLRLSPYYSGAPPAVPGKAFDWTALDGSSPDDPSNVSASPDLAEGYSAASGPLAAAFTAGAATAPTGPFLPGLSAGGILAATARFGGPLAFLSALLYPKSTAADDTCENGRCTSVFSEEKTPGPPPASTEEDAPSAKGDATTGEGAPFSWIHKKRYTTNDRLKADREEQTGEVWPIDPETGEDMQVSHEEPLADGGTDHVSNIRPRTQKDHMDLHKEREDFARWAKRRGQNPWQNSLI